ncbi:hypothetical protein CHS0354_013779 [Potamilus streckersoni]|uniref:Uncharacterized protein n=1 Tax=Potamilus streckersoni TaxID=2493646 RepID=A0AAE0SGQ9_9BIVA|nr:hypothetical protein CHS0354_013779 [Potamilus streckersoni]
MWRTVERWRMRLKTGLNFSFITRLFKRRSYSQFDSSEDIFSDAREYLETESEEDNDSLNFEDVVVVNQNRAKENNPTGVDQRNNHLGSEPEKALWTGQPDILENDKIVPFERNPNSFSPFTYAQTTASSSTFVQEEVKGMVASLGRLGYNRLDDSREDDINVSDSFHRDVELASVDDRDNDNRHVFHSIEDVPTNRTEKYRKRRKKGDTINAEEDLKLCMCRVSHSVKWLEKLTFTLWLVQSILFLMDICYGCVQKYSLHEPDLNQFLCKDTLYIGFPCRNSD